MGGSEGGGGGYAAGTSHPRPGHYPLPGWALLLVRERSPAAACLASRGGTSDRQDAYLTPPAPPSRSVFLHVPVAPRLCCLPAPRANLLPTRGWSTVCLGGWVGGAAVPPFASWPWPPHRKHERTVHDKARPYACHLCDRTFGEVSGNGEWWRRGGVSRRAMAMGDSWCRSGCAWWMLSSGIALMGWC